MGETTAISCEPLAHRPWAIAPQRSGFTLGAAGPLPYTPRHGLAFFRRHELLEIVSLRCAGRQRNAAARHRQGGSLMQQPVDRRKFLNSLGVTVGAAAAATSAPLVTPA